MLTIPRNAQLEIERAWAGYDITGVDLVTGAAVHIQCKPSGPPRSETRASEQVLLEAVAEAVAEVSPVTLRASFESYTQEAELAPATVKRWSPVIDRFAEHLGHDARRIARTDIVSWKDALLKEGKASRTVRDVYLASVIGELRLAPGGLAVKAAVVTGFTAPGGPESLTKLLCLMIKRNISVEEIVKNLAPGE